MKIRQGGADMFRADGRTDRHTVMTKPVVDFPVLCKHLIFLCTPLRLNAALNRRTISEAVEWS